MIRYIVNQLFYVVLGFLMELFGASNSTGRLDGRYGYLIWFWYAFGYEVDDEYIWEIY